MPLETTGLAPTRATAFIHFSRAKVPRGLEEPQDRVTSGHRRRVLRYLSSRPHFYVARRKSSGTLTPTVVCVEMATVGYR